MNLVERLVYRWRLNAIAYFSVLFNRTAAAIGAYHQLVNLAPRDGKLRSALGNLYAESGNLDDAVREFEDLVGVAPSDADAWFNLGFLHDKQEELELAERCFRRAIDLKPTLDRAWYGLALVLIRSGRLEEAIDALKRNIKLQPYSPYGYYQLGMTYHHLGRSAEAWKVYEQLAEFEPKYSATLKRDLQYTQPRAVPSERSHSFDSTTKEVAAVGSTQQSKTTEEQICS